MDSFGTVFVSDNDDDGNQQTRICYVMPGGNYGYHLRRQKVSHWNEEMPGIVPKILRTYFGSADRHVRLRGDAVAEEVLGPAAAHRRRPAPRALLPPDAERGRLRRGARGHGDQHRQLVPPIGHLRGPGRQRASSPTGTIPASAATAWAT